MSDNTLDITPPAKDVTPAVSDKTAVLSSAANSADAPTIQTVRAGATDTAQTHLPGLDISYDHTTGKNGEDLQTWKDSSNRVIATEEKDANGTDTVHTWAYTGNTDNVAATSMRSTDSQGHTYSTMHNYDQAGNTTYSQHDFGDGTRSLQQVTADGTVSQKFDAQGNINTMISDTNTGAVKSTTDIKADGSSETKLYDANTGHVNRDTTVNADGSSTTVKFGAHGDTTTTKLDSDHRVTEIDTKDANGNEKKTGYAYDAQTGIKTQEFHSTTDSQNHTHSTFTKYDAHTGQKTDSMSTDNKTHLGVHNHYENGKLNYEVFANNKGDTTTRYFDKNTGGMDYQVSSHADGSKQHKWYDPNSHAQTGEVDEDKNGNGVDIHYDPQTGDGQVYKLVHGQKGAYIGSEGHMAHGGPGGGSGTGAVVGEGMSAGEAAGTSNPGGSSAEQGHGKKEQPAETKSDLVEEDQGAVKMYYTPDKHSLAALVVDNGGNHTVETFTTDPSTGHNTNETIVSTDASGKTKTESLNFDPVTGNETSEDIVNPDGTKQHIEAKKQES